MILSLRFLPCKDRANPNTPRHHCTPLVGVVEKPDGKNTPSAAPTTMSSSSTHDMKRYFSMIVSLATTFNSVIVDIHTLVDVEL